VIFSCRDECGVHVETPPNDINSPPGWQYLEASKKWRCPSCSTLLREVNTPKEEIQTGYCQVEE
jgi:rubredoxin